MADEPNTAVEDNGLSGSCFESMESDNWSKDGTSEDRSEHDFISVEALSPEDLHYIVGNAKYRHILSDLLSPYLEKEDLIDDNSEAGSEGSADRTRPVDRLERGTDHTRLIQVHSLAERGARADTSALSRLGKRPSHDREGPEMTEIDFSAITQACLGD